MSLGELIKEYRKKADITAIDLAEKVGVSQSQISHIENGKRYPSMNVMERIIQVLGIPDDETSKYISISEQDEKDNNANNDKNDNKRNTGILAGKSFRTKLGKVTELQFTIETNIREDLIEESSEDEFKKIKRTFAFESPIIVNTIAEFMMNNKELKKLIVENLNNEIKRLREEYSVEDDE
ncbi:helix-turn-helix transcriptional regulator [Schinkia azotoformans]|uniref:XRE family transcriptional regulator n=1 Tax=Schinkia azotoformans LMG 9581 TaxID=1131731 RepID=K6DIY1_SCHAZ|nr:helix-turn-helix transcriptional regulator [Schinkia azotoformans]EKN68048.1 XRE family transcriptional regulator [Schinkia azotoformans LMG 9581]MEC1638146.1 helix-turn-helix transcriptional regulator [Schinkia azotoformans]MEC1946420.1 helix-turn-helix transcriptional regulator [Schinkia azotoformans]